MLPDYFTLMRLDIPDLFEFIEALKTNPDKRKMTKAEYEKFLAETGCSEIRSEDGSMVLQASRDEVLHQIGANFDPNYDLLKKNDRSISEIPN